MRIVEDIAIDVFPFFAARSTLKVMFLKGNAIVSSTILHQNVDQENSVFRFDEPEDRPPIKSRQLTHNLMLMPEIRAVRSEKLPDREAKHGKPKQAEVQRDKRVLRVERKRIDRYQGKDERG